MDELNGHRKKFLCFFFRRPYSLWIIVVRIIEGKLLVFFSFFFYIFCLWLIWKSCYFSTRSLKYDISVLYRTPCIGTKNRRYAPRQIKVREREKISTIWLFLFCISYIIFLLFEFILNCNFSFKVIVTRIDINRF